MPAVSAFYHFAPLPDPDLTRESILGVARREGLLGTVLVAHEGLNGTVAGAREGIDALLVHLRAIPGFAALEAKHSTAEDPPFGRLKVKRKAEIVSMGEPGLDPATVGTYVAPTDWNSLISAPDVAVIDTRNGYEVDIGRFAGAVDPGTESFRSFPAWWQENAPRFEGKRIAMYCTGGIRCEKATAWLKSQGVEDVYHLRGGILRYLEEVPEAESLWQGGCFVFDRRVSVTHGLEEGVHALCHGCRKPLEPADLEHPDYEPGVACHRCAGSTSAEDKARYRTRHRQMAGS